MNTLNDLPASDAAETAWLHSPWGMAVVCRDGTVNRVNPAFESHTGIAASSVLGMGEADFAARIALEQAGGRHYAQRRVEAAGDGLRAVYYFFQATPASDQDLKLSHIAEALREPLASIYGFVELLTTQDYDEEVRRDLTATVLEQVELISNIINERLDTR